jgi:selenium metabolism protein YedF
MTPREIDVRTVACPGPVLELKKALEAGEEGLCLIVADELARSNVTRFAQSRGAEVESEPNPDGGHRVVVTAGASSAQPGAEDAAALDCPVEEPAASPQGAGPRVVQVTSATMGQGDEELGSLLMRSFLKTQLQLDARPAAILFYNRGVELCCEGSVIVGTLRELEAAGIEIIACGTCLNYFSLADKLAVGRATDMLEIATRLAEAGKVVRP